MQLKVAVKVGRFFVKKSKTTGQLSGLLPDLIGAMEEMSNFTVEWETPADNQFGAPLPNGSWTGLVGMVQRKEVDLAAGPMVMSLERSEVLDFTFAYMDSHNTLVIVDPTFSGSKAKGNAFGILATLTVQSWVFFGLIFILIMLAYIFIRFINENYINVENQHIRSLYDTINVFGSENKTGAHSKRIWLLTVSMLCIVGQAYFEGALTSFLTAKAPPQKINSFFDTITFGHQVIALEGSKFATDLEKAPPGSGRHAVYNKMMIDNPDAYFQSLPSIKEALIEDPTLVLASSEFALFGDDRFMPLNGLDDAIVEQVAMGMQKDSELIGLFNHNLLQLRNSGVLDFIKP